MSAGEEFEKLLSLMARLRAPDGCPWDRKQTMTSLRPFILEEAYELVDAIDRHRPEAIREELGDLLLEVVFVTQIGVEEELFTMEEVVRGIRQKLERRHPHVFASRPAESASEALERWEEIKAGEKPGAESRLEGVPRALPALSRAMKLSSRAARAGFDWEGRDQVLEKLHEEIGELDEAARTRESRAVAEEIGDLLFVVVNLARHWNVDPELALSTTSKKFVERFRFIERALTAQGRSVEDASMKELDALWEEAKGKP